MPNLGRADDNSAFIFLLFIDIHYLCDMIEKTLGIVLATIPYNDRTTFVHIYTERFGKCTYRVANLSGRKSTATRMQLAPMTLLEMQVDHRLDREIHTIKEMITLSSPYSLAMGNPGKGAQCLFMAELLDKTIREVEPNPDLFSFIQQSIELLDLSEGNQPNFHLAFFLRLIGLLGFGIDADSYTPGDRFDIREGRFTSNSILHPYYLTPESAARFHDIIAKDFTHFYNQAFHRDDRNRLADILLLYLQLHIPEMGDLKSLDVLKELF